MGEWTSSAASSWTGGPCRMWWGRGSSSSRTAASDRVTFPDNSGYLTAVYPRYCRGKWPRFDADCADADGGAGFSRPSDNGALCAFFSESRPFGIFCRRGVTIAGCWAFPRHFCEEISSLWDFFVKIVGFKRIIRNVKLFRIIFLKCQDLGKRKCGNWEKSVEKFSVVFGSFLTLFNYFLKMSGRRKDPSKRNYSSFFVSVIFHIS